LDTSALWHTLRKKVSLINSPEVWRIFPFFFVSMSFNTFAYHALLLYREPMAKLHLGK
jgi:hypothetical protein